MTTRAFIEIDLDTDTQFEMREPIGGHFAGYLTVKCEDGHYKPLRIAFKEVDTVARLATALNAWLKEDPSQPVLHEQDL